MEKYNNNIDLSQLTDLEKISKRDQVWDNHRSLASTVESIYQESNEKWLQKYSTRINHCSPWLKFYKTEGGLKLKQAFFCKVRTCPVCSWRRSLAWKARLHKALPEIKDRHKSGRWLFLTLTLKNCYITELKENLKLINKSWDRLIRRKSTGKNILGYIKSVEVTRGKNNTAHPHLHILLFVKSTYFKKGEYLSQEDWTQEWQSALRVEYEPIVDIRAVKANDKKKSLEGAIAETLKYSVKSSDLTQSNYWLKEYTKQIFRTRAISSGGILKEIISEVDSKEMIELENQEEIENEVNQFNAYWFENSQKYRGVYK